MSHCIYSQLQSKPPRIKIIKTHAGATPLRPVFYGGLDQKLL
jgi:hypothetical protein